MTTLQNHMYSHNYLSNADWDVLQTPRIDFNTKSRTVIARLSSVGVNNPTEGTMVSLTALVYMAAHPGPPETLEVKPTHAYSTLCDLKCILRGGNQRPQQPLLSSHRIRRMSKRPNQPSMQQLMLTVSRWHVGSTKGA